MWRGSHWTFTWAEQILLHFAVRGGVIRGGWGGASKGSRSGFLLHFAVRGWLCRRALTRPEGRCKGLLLHFAIFKVQPSVVHEERRRWFGRGRMVACLHVKLTSMFVASEESENLKDASQDPGQK